MRIYSDQNKNELISVICNQCKKELKVEQGIIKEGCFCGDIRFGYFSGKDGSRHSFDLCEECYDKLIKGFAIPVEEEEVTEFI